MGRLEGKIAVITGASGGIGAATARKFLDEGAKVMLHGRDQARLDAVAGPLNGGDRVAVTVGDPSVEADVIALFSATTATFGGVDIVFANAGSEGAVAPLTSISVEDFDAVQIANIRGTWLAMKHAVAPLQARGGGAIIATASVAGVVGVPGLAAYAASKHGINGLVHVAALELAPLGIRVNAVAPGPIDNKMMASVERQASPGDPSLARTGFTALIAMGRYGRNEEVANMVAFLASDEASYCAGGIFPVDGAFLAA
jgi:NAD(P)-dependent dehydrogenase (short-subunit alcohol dehydrogenase family)